MLDSSNLNITNLQLTKLQIIRALIAEPEILIIDSYLDGINPKTAQMLITKILTFKKDLIFIVITGSKTISNLMPTYLEF